MKFTSVLSFVLHYVSAIKQCNINNLIIKYFILLHITFTNI